MENKILSTKGAMAKLQLSYRVILGLIAKGTLPAAKVAGKHRIQTKDLIEMLDRIKANTE